MLDPKITELQLILICTLTLFNCKNVKENFGIKLFKFFTSLFYESKTTRTCKLLWISNTIETMKSIINIYFYIRKSLEKCIITCEEIKVQTFYLLSKSRVHCYHNDIIILLTKSLPVYDKVFHDLKTFLVRQRILKLIICIHLRLSYKTESNHRHTNFWHTPKIHRISLFARRKFRYNY